MLGLIRSKPCGCKIPVFTLMILFCVKYSFMNIQKWPIFFALSAAVLYALSAPLSKLLLRGVSLTVLAGLLYLGAGIGMGLLSAAAACFRFKRTSAGLSRQDLPYTVGMIVLDIAAPLLLLAGLLKTSAENVSLINNFEIVSTAVIALCIFKERISGRLWLAIGFITAACVTLCVSQAGGLSFSVGSVYVLGACVCWGFENNCTRMISNKNPLEIVTVKGFGAGIGALLIAFIMGNTLPGWKYTAGGLALGFVSYGLSIFFYVLSQRYLGAAKTSAYYAAAPFVGVFLSLLIFREAPPPLFWVALALMLGGTYLSVTDTKYEAINKK